MAEKKWYSLEASQAAKELNTDLERGLTQQEAENRINTYGPNALEEAPPKSLLSMFVEQLKDPLVLVLIVAAIISGIVKGIEDSSVIMIIVVLNAALGVYQENKAEQAIKALKEMTKASVKVMRNGKINQLELDKLVPGDVVLLDTGDSVPADARLIEAASLRVNEAALTGESVPSEKNLKVIDKPEVPVGDRNNMVFKGTSVTAGRGKALIVETGMKTQLGRIAQLLQETPPEPTPLQKQLARLGKILGIAAIGIVAVTFLMGVLRGEDLIEMFMTAIALAVAAIPEGLPSVVTIVLALGVTRMSRRNAIIRKLPAVETLGVATYICSDKTGTLTKNEMTTTGLYVNDELLKISGVGYEPQGKFTKEKGEQISPAADKNIEFMLKGGALNSDAQLDFTDNRYKIIGDPTEGALVVAAEKAGLKKSELDKKYPRIGEIPFDSARKMMTTFHKMNDEVVSFTKGAPDILIARCKELLTPQGSIELTEQTRVKLLDVNSKLASQGQRVLALAVRKWTDAPENPESDTVETDLTFIGFYSIIDPAREEVKDAVAIARTAGIKTVMITGDHQDTALAIARELDIWRKGDGVLTGVQLEKMSDLELKDNVLKTSVYARVSPEHKLRIVDALKAHGHIVAMTGDGVNDAPALKRADIGSAMGITGTEVSKEASDMVLLDDNFATIVNAVEEGRTIYSNIRKSIQYLLSCNTGEIVAIFTAILLGLGSPLTPIQILWLNLVTDGPPALALGLEPPEKGVMKEKPRDPKETVFAGGVGQDILILGATIGLISLVAYWLSLQWGRTIEQAHTMAFVTMAFSQLVHSFNVRSLNQSLFQRGIFGNRALIYAFLISATLQVAVIFVPFLRDIFETELLPVNDFLIALALALTPFVVSEIVKLFRKDRAVAGRLQTS
ncbi:MAG: cation-translocating P-type ATPase [Bacillota bacterium]